jgi:hypothetical protein
VQNCDVVALFTSMGADRSMNQATKKIIDVGGRALHISKK